MLRDGRLSDGLGGVPNVGLTGPSTGDSGAWKGDVFSASSSRWSALSGLLVMLGLDERRGR